MKRISSQTLPALIVFAILLPFLLAVKIAAAGSNPPGLDTPAENLTPLKFDRLDPSIDKIIPAGAMLERIVTGFTWIEGPVWADGRLFFAEIPSNSIRTWTPGKGVSIFLQPSGYKGSAPYGGPESGSNGMTLDVRGRLTVAGHAQRDVYRFESLDPDGADHHSGRLLPRQATQQPQRPGLQIGWLALLHRSALRVAHAAGQRPREATRGERGLSHPSCASSRRPAPRPRAPSCNCW